jgi:hypothetical protein
MMPAIVEPDFVQQRLGARGRITAARNLHRHLDVSFARQRRHQVEELEHEADLFAAQPRQRVFVSCVMSTPPIVIVPLDAESRRQSAKQRRLAAARRTENCEEHCPRRHQDRGMQDGEGLAARFERSC